MDRRLLASNGHAADVALKGRVDAEVFVTPEPHRLLETAWLLKEPDGPADRECLYGDAFDVIEWRDEYAFGRAAKDGYVGWLSARVLGALRPATHWVSVRSTWAYGAPDMKSPPQRLLHMTSRVAVLEITDGWARIDDDFHVPASHLKETGSTLDQVAAARAFRGTPYVWAGNSGCGIDCSGLVQVSAHAAGLYCAADSDLQEAMAGEALAEDAVLIAGDLVFWRGHVALATGEGSLIHANAHHMAVVEEPVAEAVDRIAASETGPVTSRLRPAWSSLV